MRFLFIKAFNSFFIILIFIFLIYFIIIILLVKMKTKIIKNNKKGIKSLKKNSKNNKNKYNFKSKINKKSKKYISKNIKYGGAVNSTETQPQSYANRFKGILSSAASYASGAAKSAAQTVIEKIGPTSENYYIFIINEILQGKYKNYEKVITVIMSKNLGFKIIPLIIDTNNRTLNTNTSNYENENCFLHYQKNPATPLLNLHKLLLSFHLTPNIKEYVNVSKFSDYLEYLPLLDLIIQFKGEPNKFAKFVERFKENIKDDITFEDFDFILSIFITFFFEKQEVSEGQISIIGLINHILQIIKIINIYNTDRDLYNKIVKEKTDPAILWLFKNAGLFYKALAHTPDSIFIPNIVTPISGIYEKLKDIMEFEAFGNNSIDISHPIDISHYIIFTLKKYLDDFKVKNGFSFITFGYIEDLLNDSLNETMSGGSKEPQSLKSKKTGFFRSIIGKSKKEQSNNVTIRKRGFFGMQRDKFYTPNTGNGNRNNNDIFYNPTSEFPNESSTKNNFKDADDDDENEYFDSSEIILPDDSQISIPNLKSITDMENMFSSTTNWNNYNALLNSDENRKNHTTIYDIIENKGNSYLVLSHIISTITIKSDLLPTEFNDIVKLFNQLYIVIYGNTCEIADSCSRSTDTNSRTSNNSETNTNLNTSSITSSNKPFKEKIKLFKKKILSSFGSLFSKKARGERLMIVKPESKYLPNISLERIIKLIGGIGIKTLCKSFQDNCNLNDDGYSKFDKKLGDLFTLKIKFKRSIKIIDAKLDKLVKDNAALNVRLLFIYTIMTININRLIIKKIEENIEKKIEDYPSTSIDGIVINDADREIITNLCGNGNGNVKCISYYIKYRNELETWINSWYNSYGIKISLIGLLTNEDLKYLIQYCLPVSSNILEEFLGLRINSDNLILCSETEKLI